MSVGHDMPQGLGLAGAGGGTSRPEPRRRAYVQARRHSTWVRWLKRAIPFGAVAGLGIVLVGAVIDPFRQLSGLTLGPMSVSGTKVTMENPKLTGFRKDTRPYEVTATSAVQDVRKPNVLELKDLRARLTMDDKGSVARLEAATGVFDTQKEHLELNRDIRVRTDAGQDVRLKSASIDFKAGTVVSREPVAVTFANGTVEADALDVSDNGKVMVFTGRVRTVLDGKGEPGSKAPEAAAPAPASSAAATATPAGPVPIRASQAEPARLMP